MSDPIDDALSIIWGHPGPWSEEMRARMAKVINATLRKAAEKADDSVCPHWRRDDLDYRNGWYDSALNIAGDISSLTIPESNSTNAGEG